MNNISVLYICDKEACLGQYVDKKTGTKYCEPCLHTFKGYHAKNPESVNIAHDFLNHFDIELRTETYDEDDQTTVIKYHYILREKSANLSSPIVKG